MLSWKWLPRLSGRLSARASLHSSTLGVAVDVRGMSLVEPADELMQARIEGAAAYDKVRLSSITAGPLGPHLTTVLPPQELRAMSWLAKQHAASGSLDEAHWLARRVLDIRRTLHGNDDPRTLGAIGRLSAVLRDQGELGRAASLARERSVRSRRLLGPCHPETLMADGHAVSVLSDAGLLEEAEPIARRTHAAAARYHGAGHPDTLSALSRLGLLLRSQGKLDEAEEAMRDELGMAETSLGYSHAATLAAQSKLACTLVAQVSNRDQPSAPPRPRLLPCDALARRGGRKPVLVRA